MVSEAWEELCGTKIQLREHPSHPLTLTSPFTGLPSVTKEKG